MQQMLDVLGLMKGCHTWHGFPQLSWTRFTVGPPVEAVPLGLNTGATPG